MQPAPQTKIDVRLLICKAGLTTLIFFALIVFQSKALINLLGGFALLLSLVYIALYDRKILHTQRYLLFILLPFFIGFAFSVFSSAGAFGPLAFLMRFKFMLLIIPMSVFIRTKRDLHLLLGAFITSGCIAVIYGILTEQSYGTFNGFHRIGRTADMMVAISLMTFSCLMLSNFKLSLKSSFVHLLMILVFMLFSWAILMSEIRGSWLGFVIGCITLFIILFYVHRKASIFSFIIVAFVATFIYVGNIGDVKNNIKRINQQVESIIHTDSNNESNNARLHLWKTGWDFSKNQFLFGTGAKQSKEMFKTFFENQPNEYQKKYYLALSYPGDYHNSYLQIYIETGAIFTLSYMAGIIFLLFIIIKSINVVRSNERKYLIAAVISSVGFLVTQIFHSDLYHYGSTAFYLVLFSGCYTLNRDHPNLWFTMSRKYEF